MLQMMTTLSLRSHDLQLELFPTNDRFFNQNLVGRTQIQSPLGQFFKFLRVECNTPSGASQSEGRADDGRVTDLFNNLQGVVEIVGHPTVGGLQSCFSHRLFEEKTI